MPLSFPEASGAGSTVATTSDQLILRLFYLFYTVIVRKLKINIILFSAKIKRRHLAIIDGAILPGPPRPPRPPFRQTGLIHYFPYRLLGADLKNNSSGPVWRL